MPFSSHRLMYFIRKTGLCEHKIAERADICDAALRSYKNGETVPDFDVAERLALVINCTLEDLRQRKKDKYKARKQPKYITDRDPEGFGKPRRIWRGRVTLAIIDFAKAAQAPWSTWHMLDWLRGVGIDRVTQQSLREILHRLRQGGCVEVVRRGKSWYGPTLFRWRPGMDENDADRSKETFEDGVHFYPDDTSDFVEPKQVMPVPVETVEDAGGAAVDGEGFKSL